MNQGDQMFPKYNRNKQDIGNCFTALAYANLYALSKFQRETVNSILKYGDRLLTFTMSLRKHALKKDKDLGLTADEINQLVVQETYREDDYPKKFCISEHLIKMDLQMNSVEGHVKAKDMEDVFDVKRGLEHFFEGNKFGILTAKNIRVAVWKGQKVYYDALKIA